MPEGYKVDAAKAVGHKSPSEVVACNRRDYLLYALSVGVPATELQWLYENDSHFGPLPTYVLSLLLKSDHWDVNVFTERFNAGGGLPGVPPYNPDCIVHGEQSLEVLKPFPVMGGRFKSVKTCTGVYDKGSGMVIASVVDLYGEQDNVHYCRMDSKMFVRGYGGWGGSKGPKSPSYTPPNDHPDYSVEFHTTPHQALLYRLSGDFNPLHADPSVAQSVGLPRAILHGLASYGHVGYAITQKFANNDRHRFKSITARFASPVLPGETVTFDMWKVPHDANAFGVIFTGKVENRLVLSNGYAVIANESVSSKL
ncbi:HotDog domain-containing protein [Halteromyces radiatus]|uniref:HotDog domain-containing protein n=1 Tax=Halteromyces radiatus TaxID=101107 RepID=UPI00222067A1|nr:HotDog domain-containing protein [Halteromyces radiatus]KAI8092929.1 HotDog domain-containing protein [Halteromyces radiatus]